MILRIPFERTNCNCYLLEDDGHVIIIDPSSSDNAIAAIEEHHWTPEYIMLTHEHFDHIQGLEAVRDRYEVPVIACQQCSDRIQNAATNLSNIADILAYYMTGEIAEGRSERFTCRPAEITYEEEYQFSWRSHEFSFRRLPGHSPGSTVITLDEKRLFSGDYLLPGSLVTTRLKGGNVKDYRELAKPVLQAVAMGTEIYPGHGEIFTKLAELNCDDEEME